MEIIACFAYAIAIIAFWGFLAILFPHEANDMQEADNDMQEVDKVIYIIPPKSYHGFYAPDPKFILASKVEKVTAYNSVTGRSSYTLVPSGLEDNDETTV